MSIADYKKASGPMRQPTRRTVQEYLDDEELAYNGYPIQSRSFQALSSNVLPNGEGNRNEQKMAVEKFRVNISSPPNSYISLHIKFTTLIFYYTHSIKVILILPL